MKLILFSLLITSVIFILLATTDITIKVVNFLLHITGYDFYQGEDHFMYVNNFIIIIILVIFVIVFALSNKFLFNKKK